ncbi:MAG: DMT family transporter [Gammaproteobacteria bacterium]|jgi:drug/metabolite transporter (DMT)-like permease|nr:DMT family transporter [Gammaproteobacteria bacterium]
MRDNKLVFTGISYMLFAVFLMVCLDVAVKILLKNYPVTQIMFLRGGISLLIIGGAGYIAKGKSSFKTRYWRWHILRTTLMTISTTTFFLALSLIPLVNCMVIIFVAPIVVTALAGPFLGEVVGKWRWSAVLIGFIGILIILKPSGGFVDLGTIYAFIAAVTYALISLTSRKLANKETTYNLSFYMFIGPTLVGGVGSSFNWVVPTTEAWILFILCGVIGGVGFIFFNLAYQKAEASLLASFEYTSLIWAAAAGYYLFAETIDVNIWLGASIVILGGLTILLRESGRLKSIKN